MANDYLYIHKMAKAHTEAKERLIKLMTNALNCVKEELKQVLDVLEKPDRGCGK